MRKVISGLLFALFGAWVLSVVVALLLNLAPGRHPNGAILVVEGRGVVAPSAWLAFQRGDRTAPLVIAPMAVDGLARALASQGIIQQEWSFKWVAAFLDLPSRMAPGVYFIGPKSGLWDVCQHLCLGQGDPVLFAWPGTSMHALATQAEALGLSGNLAGWMNKASSVASDGHWPGARGFYPGIYAVDRRSMDAAAVVAQALSRTRLAWGQVSRDPLVGERLKSGLMAQGLVREGSAAGPDRIGPRLRAVVQP